MSHSAEIRRSAIGAAVLVASVAHPAAGAIMSSDMLAARAGAALRAIYGQSCASERVEGERLRFAFRCAAGTATHVWIAQTHDGLFVELAPLDPPRPAHGPAVGAGFPPEPALVRRSTLSESERAALLRAGIR